MLKITGAWTKAGLASCVKVEGPTKKDVVLLDCGVLMGEAINAKVVLVTHGHTDHIGACVSHARARALSADPASYYVPEDLVGPLNEIRVAMSKMDDKDIPMNIIAIRPGDCTMITNNLEVVVIETVHRVKSQGYAIYALEPMKLRPEFAELSREELKAKKEAGESISERVRKLELVYTGDTTFDALLNPANAFIFHARILIMELTYIDGERSKAEERGHVHLQDIVDHAHRFLNEDLVFVHLSPRYSTNRVIQTLRDSLPQPLLRQVHVNLHSFGRSEYLTPLSDPRWERQANTRVGWGWTTDRSTPA